MLYRHKQGTFEVCPYKAIYTVLINQVVEDGTETVELEDEITEEVPRYKTIEVEEVRENFVHDKEIFERTLNNSSQHYKDLVYEDFTLTEDQSERYELIRFLPESSINESIEFINGGAYPKELAHIQLARELSEREISEIIMGIQISDMEIQILELKLGGM